MSGKIRAIGLISGGLDSALAVAVVSGICLLTRDLIGYWAIALIYLSLVVFLATKLRRGTILIIAAASAMLNPPYREGWTL